MVDTRIILITGWFDVLKDGFPTGDREFVVSHGVGNHTGMNIILPCEPPSRFPGSYFDAALGEWVMPA